MRTVHGETNLPSELLAALLPLLGVIYSARTISPGKVGILRAVAKDGRATTASLTKSIGVSQQAVSLAAKELEAAGFIECRRDEEDKRRTWFHLTEEGAQKLAAESRIGHAELERRIASALTEDDRKTVEAALPALKKISEATVHE